MAQTSIAPWIQAGGSTVPERQKWGNKMEFLLSCVGMSVGLGNIWRFPYMAYSNGGAAFLIPYAILMICVGKPMYFLELVLGQFQSLGQTHAFNCFPLSKGIGVCMAYTCFFVCLYFNVLLAYALVYMVHSFKSPLPWSYCDPAWADENCFVRDPKRKSCRVIEQDLYSVFGDSQAETNDTVLLYHENQPYLVPASTYYNLTAGCTNATQTSAEQFFYKSVLQLTDGIDEPGGLKVDLTISLFISWFFVCIALLKGIKSSGKIVYFTAPAPYVILSVLLVRGITLPGAGNGIAYLLIPRWDVIINFSVWNQACQQIFYSLGASMGTIICLGSFNDFKNDLRRDIMIITMADLFTSLSGAIVVFAVLGNMAHNLNLPVASVADKGHGLAFVAYPEAASLIPGSNFWAFAFFTMLLLLAVDSQFAMFESVLVPLKDEFPILRQYPAAMSIITSFIGFVCGLCMTTRGGMYVLNLIDTYIGGLILPMIAVMELYTVSWFYGQRRLCLDIEFMLGSPPGAFVKICWLLVCPFFLTIIVIMSVARHPRTSMRGHLYPAWSDVLGVIIVVVGLLQVPLFAFLYWRKNKFNFRESLKPAHDWGPEDPVVFRNYIAFIKGRGDKRSEAELRGPGGRGRSTDADSRAVAAVIAGPAELLTEDEVSFDTQQQVLQAPSKKATGLLPSGALASGVLGPRPEPRLLKFTAEEEDVLLDDEVSVVTTVSPRPEPGEAIDKDKKV